MCKESPKCLCREWASGTPLSKHDEDTTKAQIKCVWEVAGEGEGRRGGGCQGGVRRGEERATGWEEGRGRGQREGECSGEDKEERRERG